MPINEKELTRLANDFRSQLIDMLDKKEIEYNQFISFQCFNVGCHVGAISHPAAEIVPFSPEWHRLEKPCWMGKNN